MREPGRRRLPVPAAAAAILLLVSRAPGADVRASRWSFGVFIENDVFALSDGGYTNGTKFLLVSPDRSPGGSAAGFVSFSLCQTMNTPEDIETPDLVVDDRPYAGVTYAEAGFHKVRSGSMDSLEFMLGIVGPSSLAGGIQRTLHRLFVWTYPRGWKNQLKDEALLGVFYDRKWRLGAASGDSGRKRDVIAHAGGGLSNLWTGLNGGAVFRIGRNLPRDFGPAMIAPAGNAGSILEERGSASSGGERPGYYFYASLDAHAVARDLLLDGNTFRKSPKVDKLPFTADIAAGGAFRKGRFRASFSYVYQTKRFRTQRLKPFLGSLTLAWVF